MSNTSSAADVINSDSRSVLAAGVVAVVLNLILPQEDASEAEDRDEVEVVDVEAHPDGGEKGKH